MSLRARCVRCAVSVVVVLGLLLQPQTLRAADEQLSTYWNSSISQWSELITTYARNNGLDPNLVAAIIDEESKGDPHLVSRAGAVGLMQIMPYEAGFTWRPHAYLLKDPETNLEWGTNTLSQVIRQAQGRVSLALLAYNSGWDRIHLHSTRTFATKVLDQYVHCILSDGGIDPAGVPDYALYVVAHNSAGPTYVDRVQSHGKFEPLSDFDPTTLSPDLPHAVAYATIDGNHIAWWVDVWVEPLEDQGAPNL